MEGFSSQLKKLTGKLYPSLFKNNFFDVNSFYVYICVVTEEPEKKRGEYSIFNLDSTTALILLSVAKNV